MKAKTLGLIGITALGIGVIYYVLKKQNKKDETYKDNGNIEIQDNLKESFLYTLNRSRD